MDKNQKVIFKILSATAFVLLIIPAIQKKYQFVKESSLKGAIVPRPNAYFSVAGWFDGTYQKQKEEFLNENFGFRNFFVRVNNQVAFYMFNKAKANGVIIGKKNYLYELNYLKAYSGADFITEDSARMKFEKIKFIQEKLSSLNKTFILVFAAGKASFYPEYIPDKYLKKINTTNYRFFKKLAIENNINLIDFNDWFVKNKSISKYPLYPRYGIHWSYYGTLRVADSLISYIEAKRKISTPRFKWDEIEFREAYDRDYDIGDGMNLLFKLNGDVLAYPKMYFEADKEKTKPRVLVIADSFYWPIYDLGLNQKCFDNNQFWFYNNEIYPNDDINHKYVWQVDLNKEINDHDVFIVMATEANLSRLGWGFFENASAVLDIFKKNNSVETKSFGEKVKNLIDYIKTDSKWLESIKEKAASNNTSADEQILKDAIWMIENESSAKK